MESPEERQLAFVFRSVTDALRADMRERRLSAEVVLPTRGTHEYATCIGGIARGTVAKTAAAHPLSEIVNGAVVRQSSKSGMCVAFPV